MEIGKKLDNFIHYVNAKSIININSIKNDIIGIIDDLHIICLYCLYPSLENNLQSGNQINRLFSIFTLQKVNRESEKIPEEAIVKESKGMIKQNKSFKLDIKPAEINTKDILKFEKQIRDIISTKKIIKKYLDSLYAKKPSKAISDNYEEAKNIIKGLRLREKEANIINDNQSSKDINYPTSFITVSNFIDN